MARTHFNENVIRIIAENKLQTAIENGEFDNLPGLGKPFEFDERDYHPNWWIQRKLEREKLKNVSVSMMKPN